MSMLKTTSFSSADFKKTLKAFSNSNFLTFEAKLAFVWLKQAFTKAPILYHFDLKRFIRIETNASGYTIGDIFSQLTPESS